MSGATWKRTERSIAGIIGGERVPVAIIHRHGARPREDIVCVRFADFTVWFGPLDEQEDGHNDG